MPIILHMTPRAQWEAAQTVGYQTAESLQTQGFIHCSTAAQVVKVANKHYRSQNADLVLLCIDTDKLTSPWKFEPPINPKTGEYEATADEEYPHIYGTINLASVVRVVDFPANADGLFSLPEAIWKSGY
ncbi:MAG: DUF952 domain-containing protein [Anaerolineae bacterium]|nr:DUF952 domain-containing protein [Anaerolineae bacterium]